LLIELSFDKVIGMRTADDSAYLAKLQDHYALHRVLPPYAAMGRLLKLRSKSSVAALVLRLKGQGFLAAAPDRRLRPTPRFFERAFAESVRGGFPSPAEDALHDSLSIDEYLVEHPSRTVLVKVKGDSMADAGIYPGDIAVVERQPEAQIGDTVVAVVDGEFTLKYLAQEKGRPVLRPANPAYPVLRPVGELQIFGVLVGLIRKYR
jgi:SOS-response transcriptional repressor LexA